jgi:hypothetical protein
MRLIVAASVFLLAACAATGPAEYGPADSKGFGYDEQRIEEGRYRITYRGSGGMPPEVVEDYALRRAAELAVAGGYDWFRVIGRGVDGEKRGGVSVGTGFGTGSYGRRSSVGVGVGADLGRIGAQDFFTARIEVLMGKGDGPDDGPGAGEVYEAQSVLESLAGPAADPYNEE